MTRLGISVGWSARESLDRMVGLVGRAESLGVDACWVIDSQVAMRDPFVLLAVLARGTRRIAVGPGVTNLVTRHETVVATTLATLAEIAPGRVLAGVGVGDSAVYGIGLHPQRLAEFEVGLKRLRSLLRGDKVTMADRSVGIAAANTPPPPLFVAASQPKMLALAGQVADGVIVMGPANVDVYRSQIEQIRRSASAAGRNPDDVVVDLWVTMAVGDDGVDSVRSWASAQARWLDRWKRLPASLTPFRGDLARAAADYDFAAHLAVGADHAYAVSDELAAQLAVAGPLDHCRQRLAEVIALGPDRVTVPLLSGGRERRLDDLMSVWEGVADR